MPPYQPSSQINHADTETLVVYCSDHRFQAGIREFLNAGLNLDNNYDLLVIPGGPQCLSLIEYLPKFAWAGRRWLNFLKDAHAIKRIILVAHQDCGWYKALPFHLHTSSEPRLRQEEDLRRVERALMKEFPELRVELYYAAWDADDQVTVYPVSI